MIELLKYENVNWDLPYILDNNIKFINTFFVRVQLLTEKIPFKYLHSSFHSPWGSEEPEVPIYMPINFPGFINRRLVKPIGSFSKYNITDDDLKNKQANLILEKIIDSDGEIELSSDKLYDYIKKRYPNTKIIASLIKSEMELEQGNEVYFYNNLLDKYDKVILHPKYVKEKFFNDSSKFNDISRLEIIVNERCINNCPNVKECIKSVENEHEYLADCPKNNMSLKDLFNSSLALNNDDIDILVNEIGIKNLRIKGQRFTKEDLRYTILNYMLKQFGISTFFMWFY